MYWFHLRAVFFYFSYKTNVRGELLIEFVDAILGFVYWFVAISKFDGLVILGSAVTSK